MAARRGIEAGSISTSPPRLSGSMGAAPLTDANVVKQEILHPTTNLTHATTSTNLPRPLNHPPTAAMRPPCNRTPLPLSFRHLRAARRRSSPRLPPPIHNLRRRRRPRCRHPPLRRLTVVAGLPPLPTAPGSLRERARYET